MPVSHSLPRHAGFISCLHSAFSRVRFPRRCGALSGHLTAKVIAVSLLVFLTATMLMAQAQGSGQVISPDGWAWQNPLPQGNDLHGVWGSSSSDVYAVGAGGIILHYDGGAWSGLSSNTTTNLYGAWGSPSTDTNGNANDVYVVGAAGIILHYDGTVWNSLTSNTTNDLQSVWGSSATDVYAVGAGGIILHYGGTGTAWSPMGSGTTKGLTGVWAHSATDVYAVGNSGTALHYDGNAWHALSTGVTFNFYGVWGSSSVDSSGNANDVYIVGNDDTGGGGGYSLHFNGTTWNSVSYLNNVYAVSGSSATDVCIAGSTGEYSTDIRCSADSGSFAGPLLYGLWVSPSSDFFAVGANGSIVSDYGLQSSGLYFNGLCCNSYAFSGVAGSSSTDVFVVGDAFTHYDGKAWTNWGSFSSTFPGSPWSVWVNSPTDVYAIGGVDGYWHYDGATWSGDVHLFSRLIGTISFLSLDGVWGASIPPNGAANPVDIFVAGTSVTGSNSQLNGIILQGSGSNWTAWTSNTSSLHGVWGSSLRDANGYPNDVYAVGAGGTIVHFDGTSWSPVNSGTANDLYGVWGSSALDVYAVGIGGIILHFDGTSWTVQNSATSNDLSGIWGSSATDVFVVGSGGTILHYDGSKWSSMKSGTQRHLRGVWGSSSTTVFAVGDSSTILQYEPPTTINNPLPTLTSISPSTMSFSTANVALTVVGTQFIPDSSVQFNGSGVTTTYVSNTKLTAIIPAVTSVGTFTITIFNPTPGGGTSNAHTLTISKASTILSMIPAFSTYGGTVTLSATLTSGGSTVSSEQVTFSVNGTPVGTVSTNAYGVANLAVPLSGINSGAVPVVAVFTGDRNYVGSSTSVTLTVNQASTALYLGDSGGQYGGTANLTASLTSVGAPVPGKTVTFNLNGVSLGSAITDAFGSAMLSGVSLKGLDVGGYHPTATFAGDNNYSGSSTSGVMAVIADSTTTSAADATWVYNNSAFTLSATVTSSSLTTVNEGTVEFAISDCRNGPFWAGSAPVINGKAVASISTANPLWGCSPGWHGAATFPIQASYHGDARFSNSQDLSHSLTVYVNTSDVSIFSLGPADSQPDDPKQLTLSAIVHNDHSSETAYDVWVGFDVTDPKGICNVLISCYIPGISVGILPPGAGSTVQVTVRGDGFPPNMTIRAYVTSSSFDPNQANNQTSMLLNGFYTNYFQIGTDGYSFANQASRRDIDWSLYEETFGSDTVDAGTFVNYFGIVTPAQWFYESVYKQWFAGNCYGMSASSLRFFKGEDYVGNWGGTTVNSLQTDFTEYNDVWRNIEKFQGYELGDPIFSRYMSHSWDATQAVTELENATNSSRQDPGILVLLDGTSAHAVVPNRIIDTTSSDGTHNAAIWVYDNNNPNRIGTPVQVNLTNNTFSYSGYSSGFASGIMEVPSSFNNSQPSLVISSLGFFVGSVSGSANMLNTDMASGNSVGFQKGTLVEQIPGARLLRPLADSAGDARFPEVYGMPAGEYQTTLLGNGTGSATAGLFRPGSLLAFTSNGMTPATQDTIVLSKDGNTATLATNAARENYSATMYRVLGSSSVRDYAVSNMSMASGDQITLAVINGGASFEIVNQGSAKFYDLTLLQVTAGVLSKTSFSGLSIGANETDTFIPSDWNNLGTAPVTLQIQNSQGTTSGTLQAAAINSASSASFTYGTGGTFTVTATGFPKPALSGTGALPNGISFSPSTGVLSGTPASGTVGTYNITFTAVNGAGSTAQSFMLTVNPAPLTVTANNATRQYGQANPAFTGTITGLVNGDNITATYSTTATPASNVGSYAIAPTLVDLGGKLGNYAVTVINGTLTVSTAPLTVTAPSTTKILDAPNPALNNVTYSGFMLSDGPGTLGGTLKCTTTATPTSSVGSYSINCSGLTSSNYAISYASGTLKILYAPAGGTCDGDLSHTILQPINADGTSVWKQGRTVPAKFRVCDANGVSIGTPGVVASFNFQIISGTVTNVDETVASTNADTAFRWDSTGQLWIFNISTSNLNAGYTYVYAITLNDGTVINFQYGLR